MMASVFCTAKDRSFPASHGLSASQTDQIRRLPCLWLLIDFQHVAPIGSIGLTFIAGAY
jgi:hypothetical protein